MSRLTIETKRLDPDALFLRQALVEGSSPTGTEIELSQSGDTLILSLRFPDGDRVKESITLTELTSAWTALVIDGEEDDE